MKDGGTRKDQRLLLEEGVVNLEVRSALFGQVSKLFSITEVQTVEVPHYVL
jgi:hypothetical protein